MRLFPLDLLRIVNMASDDDNAQNIAIDPTHFEWTPGDQEFHIKILDSERVIEDPPTNIEGHQATWQVQFKWAIG